MRDGEFNPEYNAERFIIWIGVVLDPFGCVTWVNHIPACHGRDGIPYSDDTYNPAFSKGQVVKMATTQSLPKC